MPCWKVCEKEVPCRKVCEKVWVDGGYFLNTNKSALSVVFLANTPNSRIIHFHVTYFVSHMSWDILIDCVFLFFIFIYVNGLILTSNGPNMFE